MKSHHPTRYQDKVPSEHVSLTGLDVSPKLNRRRLGWLTRCDLLRVGFFFFLSASNLFAQSNVWKGTYRICFQWRTNSEPDLAGYRLYQGVESGMYTQRVDLPGAAISNACMIVPRGVTNYFTLTAYNWAGLESEPAGPLFTNRPPLQMEMQISQVTGMTNTFVAIEQSTDFVNWLRIYQVLVPPTTNDAAFFRGIITLTNEAGPWP